MSTSYNTLTLGAVTEERKPRKMASVVAAGLSLVAIAGAAAFFGRTAFATSAHAMDSQYQALDATPVNCDKSSPDFSDSLPMWDPNFSNQEDFYNSCYYSFRCCTTTGNGNGRYVSDNFGDNCRSCLKNNGPRFVKGDCAKWLADDDNDTSEWTEDDLMKDKGIPSTSIPAYSVLFKNFARDSCWAQRGAADKMVVDYASKCFEVLSWCNLLCPRDTPQTVDHVMCKHCTLFGFEKGYWDKETFDNGLKGENFGN